ncbi:hypothetical protein CA13_34130 [Planctomycetes bacterium CA13]|uniref:Uncharacterized protein n=1 Tax=Novipirellula herctigrandis TaxID=2527986 RepID=A0A5C5Z3P3_9BACT|nr:hypothetical protein CA13_34130 [Planctomycetes bacterium CA13]
MKIKCPGCSKALNVPDTAAGKIVQCSCGKKLRAPGGASVPTSAAKPGAAKPAAPKPAAPKPSAASPAVASGGFGGFDPEMFDELTESDLEPVAAVVKPGVAPKVQQSAAGGNALQEHSGGDSGGASKPSLPIPMIVIGILNGLVTLAFGFFCLVMFGLVAVAIPQLEEQPDAATTGVIGVALVIALMIPFAFSLLNTIACFVSKPICWYFLAFSYAFSVSSLLMTLIGSFSGEANLFLIGLASIRILVGGSILAYLNVKQPRRFFRVDMESLPKHLAPNIAGAAIGFGLGVVSLLQ